VAPERLKATGCPRYDFCAEPWRRSLPKPSGTQDYILINTNFPTVNPRFSPGPNHEINAMVQAGFDETFARRFIADAGEAQRQVIATMHRLASHFSDLHFVLRPHPFENIAAYDKLAALPNFTVRQENTSIEWLNRARLLLHQNCSTAIEAMMLGLDAVALEWFNTEALRLEPATMVSHLADSESVLFEMVEQARGGRLPPLPAQQETYARQMIENLYLAIDGNSAERVTDAVLQTIEGRKDAAQPQKHLSGRGRVARLARKLLGYRLANQIRTWRGGAGTKQRQAKSFPPADVQLVLARINAVSQAAPAMAEIASTGLGWSVSGASVRICPSGNGR